MPRKIGRGTPGVGQNIMPAGSRHSRAQCFYTTTPGPGYGLMGVSRTRVAPDPGMRTVAGVEPARRQSMALSVASSASCGTSP